MKKLILILTILFSVFTYSQEEVEKTETVTKTTVYNDSKEAVKEVYSDVKSLSPEIKETIQRLANSFNTTVDKLWDILVRQQKVYSICFLILTLSALFNWWLFYKKNFIKLEKGNYIKGIKIKKSLISNPKHTTYNNEPITIVDGETYEDTLFLIIIGVLFCFFEFVSNYDEGITTGIFGLIFSIMGISILDDYIYEKRIR